MFEAAILLELEISARYSATPTTCTILPLTAAGRVLRYTSCRRTVRSSSRVRASAKSAPMPTCSNAPDRQTALHATVGFVVVSIRRAVYMVPPRVMAKYALGRVNNLIGSGKVIAGRRTRIHRRYPSFSRCRQNERTARVRMRGHCDRRGRYLRYGTACRPDVHLGRLSHSIRRRRIVDR
jgi:hypothetical protein